MKIAIVHDYFIQQGGAERVAEELQSIFPSSTMVTTVDIHKTPGRVSSWMRHLPITEKNHRLLFMLYPLAVETLDLTAYDLIISSSSGYAKGVRKRKDAVHICYCHTPMRWIWRYEDYSERENFGKVTRRILPAMLSILKRWDLAAAKRPDHYIANSQVTRERIARFYGRHSVVIPPPIDTKRVVASDSIGDHYLILSRLAPYKRLDLAIEACKRLNKKLVVIGDGPARSDLEAIAGRQTEFLGRVDDKTVAEYASTCKALLFPGEEDFGMTPLEINAAGRPVIAFGAGGALETIIPGKTGIFFDGQTPESLAAAIGEFETRTWDRDVLMDHANKFSTEVFAASIKDFVENAVVSSAEQPVWAVSSDRTTAITSEA
jgi:glycosyltransferase involved in cell wall biosynthesis